MKVLTIRLDDKLHARIKQAADREARSLNGQIAWLLDLGLDTRDNPVNAEDWRRRINEGHERAHAEHEAKRSPVVGYSKERQARGRKR